MMPFNRCVADSDAHDYRNRGEESKHFVTHAIEVEHAFQEAGDIKG